MWNVDKPYVRQIHISQNLPAVDAGLQAINEMKNKKI